MAKTSFSWRGSLLKTDLPATTKHILLTLSLHVNDADERCFPSIQRLCKETGLSNRTVISHLHDAEKLGWIVTTKNTFSGQAWARNSYRLAWPEGSEPDSKGSEPDDIKGGEPDAEGGELNDEGSEPDDIKQGKVVKEVHTNYSLYIYKTYIPEWMPMDVWNDFGEYRKKLKKPLVERSEKMLIRELERLKEKGYNPVELLETAMLKGWLTVYEPKGQAQASPKFDWTEK